MHTLAQLRSGELRGIKELKLQENLTSFPVEILELADTLELLDLSNNAFTSLPKEFAQLKKLKIAFFANNLFTSIPDVFKGCENLYMLGFKANKLEKFDEDILPLSISWLILTDNSLNKLPDSIGKLTQMKKFAIAGNKLKTLPPSMKNMKELELLRLSANNLEEIPSWLLELPKLSWLGFSGNPCAHTPRIESKEISLKDLEIQELLGEGASGEIFKAYSHELKTSVAAKFFKGAVTSDGYAKDEMNACLAVKEHENLIKVVGRINDEEKVGLLLEYISSEFKNLGNPPNFETCTRDRYETTFTCESISEIAKSIVSVASHLHAHNLKHGDLYAHNILINREDKCYLGDFGAASFYDSKNTSYEKIEVRAFGCLLDDMLMHCSQKGTVEYTKLVEIRNACMNEKVILRPLFRDIIIS